MKQKLKSSTIFFLVFLLLFSSFGTALAEGSDSEDTQEDTTLTDDVIHDLTEEEFDELRWIIFREQLLLYEFDPEAEPSDEAIYTTEEELAEALHQFQADHDLEEASTYTEEAWEKMNELLEDQGYLLFVGQNEEETAELKHLLKELDPHEERFQEEELTTFYGIITAAAVKSYQETRELTPHGAVDEETYSQLSDEWALFREEQEAAREDETDLDLEGREEEVEEDEAREEDTESEEESDLDSEAREEEAEEEADSDEESDLDSEAREEEAEEDEAREEEADSDEESDLDSEAREEEAEEDEAREEEADSEEESDLDSEAREEEAEEDEVREEDADSDEESDHDSEAREDETDEGAGEAAEEDTYEQDGADSSSDENEAGESAEEAKEDLTEEEQAEPEEAEESFSSMSTFSTADEGLVFEDGDEAPEIREMKLELTKLGFGTFPSDPSERFGPVTMGVVADFQSYFGLEADCQVDPETFERISEEAGTYFQDFQEGEGIQEFKMMLTSLEYGSFPSSPSDRFGPVTTSVVKDFQADNGLVVNGLGDSVTMQTLHAMAEDVVEGSSLELPYVNGDEGPAVRDLKLMLTKLGFGSFPADPSERYGPVTMSVVEDFQRYFGLSVNGITDQQTLNRVEQEAGTIFQDGNAHSSIVDLKLDLTRLGYGTFPSNPSNRYGPVTSGVVKEFQSSEGLVTSGIADSRTMERLEQRVAEHYDATLTLPYEDGDQGSAIVQLKKDLTTLGFGTFPSSPSVRYGPVTMRVVEDFQEYYGLPITGITNQTTANRIQSELNSRYRDGQAHADIVTLKLNLTKLGFGTFPTSPSNRYGAVTSSVVRDFQEANGLVVNGIGDSVTMSLLDSQVGESFIGKAVVTANSNLNVRRGPSTNFSVIGQLPTGTVVDVISEENGWYRISHSSITEQPAYVSGMYLQMETDGLSYPYQNGDRGEEIVEMKQNLTKLGFGSFPSNPSEGYGSVTERVVREFQDYYGRTVNGRFSQSDADFIDSIFNSNYIDGAAHENVRELKRNLSRLGFGSFPSSPSNRYGEVTAAVVRDFQRHHGLVVNGIGDPRTMQQINDEMAKIGNSIEYRNYQMTVSQMLNRQMPLRPQTDLYGGGWQNALEADVRRYVDPNRFTLEPGHRDMFQFLVLSQTSGVPASQLNNILRNRGILHNTGNAFKQAAESQGVNDIYLISHALLETGNGTSRLSDGSFEVGQINSNMWVSVQPQSNGSVRKYTLERRFNSANNSWSWISRRDDSYDTSRLDMKKTYNMFGIEAIDSDPYTRGSVRAYREGWFTPQASIQGGAQFISNNYLNRGQDTLYKMRWDPDFHEAALNSSISINRSSFYQYATDIGWAYKQTRMIKELYDQIDNPYLPFEVPVYR
ncbi:peptidoglycan-binding protein [Alkalicoccus luteus]|uniref:SH3 domain-containing protein n=1 Tax=Alkalicoccus luteus TaxID=1237094 RepID=A0A969PS70_9BACI|nr:peptidoglycan-binding protein [Alkalicoccus luteus]NJP37426.1 SH3 domain-containing protein [Alkalicoccus luteus]